MNYCKDCGAKMIPGAISDGWCSAECDLPPKDEKVVKGKDITLKLTLPDGKVVSTQPTKVAGFRYVAVHEDEDIPESVGAVAVQPAPAYSPEPEDLELLRKLKSKGWRTGDYIWEYKPLYNQYRIELELANTAATMCYDEWGLWSLEKNVLCGVSHTLTGGTSFRTEAEVKITAALGIFPDSKEFLKWLQKELS